MQYWQIALLTLAAIIAIAVLATAVYCLIVLCCFFLFNFVILNLDTVFTRQPVRPVFTAAQRDAWDRAHRPHVQPQPRSRPRPSERKRDTAAELALNGIGMGAEARAKSDEEWCTARYGTGAEDRTDAALRKVRSQMEQRDRGSGSGGGLTAFDEEKAGNSGKEAATPSPSENREPWRRPEPKWVFENLLED
ncbi:hypothetical protein F5Y16DRAFT_265088 [Xylariaceae sp. FL0255]|nr:hypothetical protein F5Y16DRAFT_265088 [Xylariaceae sp. FL0255]